MLFGFATVTAWIFGEVLNMPAMALFIFFSPWIGVTFGCIMYGGKK
jgi:hypothetical protein